MTLTKKRWLLLAAACAICFAAGSIYSWSVFADPMAQHLSRLTGQNLTGADLAVAFAMANGIGPIPMILGGAVTDRFGPRIVILCGGLLIGMGLYLSGCATSLTMLMLTYGLVFGLGLGMTYGCVINNTMKFFPDHRGLVGGLTTAVYGGCSVVLPPIANYVNAQMGVASSFQLFGAVFGAVILVGAMFSEKCPADFQPQGCRSCAQPRTVGRINLNWRRMMATPLFWSMIGLLLCGAVSAMMILSQAAGIAARQMCFSGVEAAACVSVLALANVGGRLVAGSLSDRFGRLPVLGVAVLVQISALGALILAAPSNPAWFYLGLIGTGLSFGSLMGVFPGFTADAFGTAHNSVNYGIMFCGFSAAGLIGPQIMRRVLAAGGAYSDCYAVAMGVATAGLVCLWLCRRFARS